MQRMQEPDHLIDLIYAAGIEPTGWHDVIKGLAYEINGSGGALHAGDTSGFGFGAEYNVDPAALSAYAQHYFALNPLNAPLTRLSAGSVVGHHQLVRPDEYRKTQFYSEYSKSYDVEGSATAVIGKSNGQVACLGIIRGCGCEPFSQNELETLRYFLPHLQRALAINWQLARVRAERDQAHAALDELETAIFFISEMSDVIRLNAAAETLVRSDDGLQLRRNRLLSSNASVTACLAALISQAINSVGAHGGTLTLPRPSGARALVLHVVPYKCEMHFLDAPQIRALAFVTDPSIYPIERTAEVAEAYGLTKAESRLVGALIQGLSLKEAAEAHGIAQATARNHVARAMQKTDTDRQSELMRLISESRLRLR